jgi:hypothetical protein
MQQHYADVVTPPALLRYSSGSNTGVHMTNDGSLLATKGAKRRGRLPREGKKLTAT